VKIDESRQNEGTFRLGARRHRLSVDNRDRLAGKPYLTGHPSVESENGAFWRCRGGGGHSCCMVSPKRSEHSSGACLVATSQQPVSASAVGSRIGRFVFLESSACRREARLSAEKSREDYWPGPEHTRKTEMNGRVRGRWFIKRIGLAFIRRAFPDPWPKQRFFKPGRLHAGRLQGWTWLSCLDFDSAD